MVKSGRSSDDDWAYNYAYPFFLGIGYGTTINPVPQDLPKEKVKQKQRIGFHIPSKVKK